ncbi:MAG: glycosyltransferase family 4 protein [Chloroflexi bacterium]|nr:glycosyltransferase family 4 protein [Chloroflexota bacterium]
MRLLVLSDTYPPANLGGAGEVAALVSERLAALGHEVLVVTGVARRQDAGHERHGGLTVRRLWTPVPSALRLHLSLLHPLSVLQMGRIARAFRPDAVHAHNVHERLSFASLGVVGASGVRRQGGPPLLLTAHDYLLFCLTKFLCASGDVGYRATPAACRHCRHIRRVPARNMIVHRLVQRNVSAIACISRAQRTALAANGFAGVPLEVVHNGIDPAACTPPAGQDNGFRARYNLDRRPLVLFGGRISGAKGGDQLLRAMVHARRRLDCQLAILGDRQAYFAHARRLAAEVGLDTDALHPIGWLSQTELVEAFAAADVCATPSVYPDPFNLMTLRAMACRKPVVGTCYGATPEIVVDGVTGFIADPWQPEQFGERLAELLLDPGLARRIGEAGRARLEQEFTLEKQISAYVSLFDRLRDARPKDRTDATEPTPDQPHAAIG